jgi:hypothetical protein
VIVITKKLIKLNKSWKDEEEKIKKNKKEKQLNYPCPHMVMLFLFIFIEIPTFFPSSQTRHYKCASLIIFIFVHFLLSLESYKSNLLIVEEATLQKKSGFSDVFTGTHFMQHH